MLQVLRSRISALIRRFVLLSSFRSVHVFKIETIIGVAFHVLNEHTIFPNRITLKSVVNTFTGDNFRRRYFIDADFKRSGIITIDFNSIKVKMKIKRRLTEKLWVLWACGVVRV